MSPGTEPVRARVGEALREVIGVDLRSLGLLRIALGALLLTDLGRRALELRMQYTDLGLLPREALRGYGPDSSYTLHGLLSGSEAAVSALFAFAALAALAVLLGMRTRLALFVSWVLLASVQWRNPPLNNGGDVMLRMLLFWGLFLPLGARFSLDARRDPALGAQPNRLVSAAGLALLLQLCLVYVFALANRTGATWWQGEALWTALHFDLFATPIGVWLRQYEAILPPLTLAALYLEGLGPLLAFSPFWSGPLRCATILLFLGLHLAIALLFSLGQFQAVFMAAWLAFLPGWFWDRVSARRIGVPPRPPAPAPPARRPGWIAAREAMAAVLFAYVVLCNLNTVRLPLFESRFPPAWTAPAEWLRIDQRWGLFAPDPPVNDGWYVVIGERADGSEIDLLRPPRPASFDKPVPVSASLSVHLRYFFIALEQRAGDPRWEHYGRFLCRDWNAARAGDQRLVEVRVYFVRETTRRPEPRRGEIVTLLVHACA
jgi:hypothetical protein